jgi:prepilin-type N-terminal cleavage/methylation domain-containing protein
MKARTRRAFSLVELLTVIGIIALLISILMPALGRARELARRTVCLANLRGIAQGCVIYAEGAKGHFPCWGQKQPGVNAIGDYWDWDGVSPNTFSGTAISAANNSPVSNTRNLWRLVLMQGADTKTWLCPSDGEAGEPFAPAVVRSQVQTNSSISDVQNRSQLSYTFQYQGPALNWFSPGTIREGWNTTTRNNPKLVILADASPAMHAKNPSATAASDDHTFEFASNTPSTTFPAGNRFATALLPGGISGITWDATTAQASYKLANAKDLESLNSPNHRGEGQNFLRLDGSGDFAADPWAGAYKDNIWTVQHWQATVPQAAADRDSQDLAARMIGLCNAGSCANNFDVVATVGPALLEDWVRLEQCKDPYPDSFLVP